ncbi:unnamed protein product [Rotaria sordida]|uniref:Tetratricopeptide repeat protein 29 n=1 Tax=Rotaria sordida TaxID=392033 RepID=A0A819AS76_9BILA|nr:unnamed protein product [Rotaria sordida]
MAETYIHRKKSTNETKNKNQSTFFHTSILPSKTYQEKHQLPLKELKTSVKDYKKQPSLQKVDTEKYRNSLQRQLSIDMLRQGYHQSFRELCTILEWQKNDREQLGVEHPHYRRSLLDGEPDKLRFLCIYLNKIEEAERRKQYSNIYKNYIELASFFLKSDDHWLSDLFYKKCLSVAQTYTQFDSKLVAEAYLNVGLVYERQGNLMEALNYFETYRQLSENYYQLKTDANLQLTRLYIKLAEHKKDNEALSYIIKAYETSKQSDNKKLENETAYKLGYAYLELNDIELALKYFHKYYDYCQQENDNEGFSQASEALAICYQKKENVEQTSEYLTKCLQRVSNKIGDNQYARACSTLGFIEATLGHYDSAIESSSKAYSIALVNSNTDLNRNRVLYGIVNGLKLRSIFIDYIDQMNICNLIEWKSTRLENYLKN